MEVNSPIAIVLSSIIIIWTYTWKGIALWTAAKHTQKRWFIGLLIATIPVIMLNAIGILDIVYLFFFAKKKLTFEEIKSWKNIFYKRVSFQRKKY